MDVLLVIYENPWMYLSYANRWNAFLVQALFFSIDHVFSLFPLQDFRQLLDDDLELVAKLRDWIIDWVQEGFQDFFRELEDRFLLLSERNSSSSHDQVLSGLVLVIAQLSLFIEQTAIPRITEVRNRKQFVQRIDPFCHVFLLMSRSLC